MDWFVDHIIIVIAVLVLVAGGIIGWVIATGQGECPKGQQTYIVSYYPMIISVGQGETMTVIEPIYGCQKD